MDVIGILLAKILKMVEGRAPANLEIVTKKSPKKAILSINTTIRKSK